MLYSPGSSLKMMRKAAGLDVDSVCLDLEDAVALNMKEEAREFVKQALNEYDFGRSEVLVRVNSVGSGLEEGDVASLLCVEDGERQVLPHGIVLPKVEHADHLLWLRERITTYALASRRITHPLSIIAIIETPTAVATLRDILLPNVQPQWGENKYSSLEALIFGADDYAALTGATRSPQLDNFEVDFARNMILMQAKAVGLQCIDMVKIDFRDQPGFEKECEYGQRLGYTGKQLIHPSQIAAAHQRFAPALRDIQWSQRVVQADEEHQKVGTGAFSLDGHMIDAPTVKQAQRLLARARACGLIDA